MLDPAKSRGTVRRKSPSISIWRAMRSRNVTYSVNADLANFVGEGLLMGQKVEAQSLHVIADSKEFQVKGDARINGTPAALDFIKATAIRWPISSCSAVLDEAARRRLGINFGAAVSGNVPVTLTGRIGSDDGKNQTQRRRRFHAGEDRSVVAGLGQACRQAGAVTFALVKDAKSTRFDNLTSKARASSSRARSSSTAPANWCRRTFPVFALSGGDQVSLQGRPHQRRRHAGANARRRL